MANKTEKKMTYVEAITIAMESADSLPKEVEERLNDLIHSLSNHSKSKKQTQNQELISKVSHEVLVYMEADPSKEFLLNDLIVGVIKPALGEDVEVTTSKASQFLTPLVDEGLVEKGKSKGKTTYKVASMPEA